MNKTRTRIFPLIISLLSGIIMRLLAGQTGGDVLVAVSGFSFTVFILLFLVAFFADIGLGQDSFLKKIINKIKSFLREEEIYFGFKAGQYFNKFKDYLTSKISPEKYSKTRMPEIDTEINTEEFNEIEEREYTELQKISSNESRMPSSMSQGNRVEPVFFSSSYFYVTYINLFLVIALWRLINIFSFSYHFYSAEIYNVLIFILLFITISLYLKMRKPGNYIGDKLSYGLLKILSIISLLFSALIMANFVLDTNLQIFLEFVINAGTIYVFCMMGANILLSIFRKNLGNFDYNLLPVIFKSRKKEINFLDTDEVKNNFSIKSLYTFKYALKIIPGTMFTLVFLVFLSTSFFIVQPHQQALVYRFGRISENVRGEGIHSKLPWPFEKAEIYDVFRLNSLQIGYDSQIESNSFLWTEAHTGRDYLLLTGNGNELIAVNIRIIYNISDLIKYINHSSNPEIILSAEAYRVLMNRTIHTTLDNFLCIDRESLSFFIREELSYFSVNEKLGIAIIDVIIESIHPPVETVEIYQYLISASVEKNTIITDAHTLGNYILINAERQNRIAVNDALKDHYNRISIAEMEMSVYHAAMEAYNINSESFRLNRYLNTFETIINQSRVFVFSPAAENNMSSILIGNNTPVILR